MSEQSNRSDWTLSDRLRWTAGGLINGDIEDGSVETELLVNAAAEIDRLTEAKRRALQIADERAKEANELRAENKALAEDLRNSLEDAIGARNQLVKKDRLLDELEKLLRPELEKHTEIATVPNGLATAVMLLSRRVALTDEKDADLPTAQDVRGILKTADRKEQ